MVPTNGDSVAVWFVNKLVVGAAIFMNVYDDFYQTLQRWVQGYVRSLHSLFGIWVDWSLTASPASKEDLRDLLIKGKAVSKGSKALFIQTVQSIFELPYPVILQPWSFRFKTENDYNSHVTLPKSNTSSDLRGLSINVNFYNDKILTLVFKTVISDRYNVQMELIPLIRKAETPFWYYGNNMLFFKYDLDDKRLYDLVSSSKVFVQNLQTEEIARKLKYFSIFEPGLSPLLNDSKVKLVYLYSADQKSFLCEFYLEDPEVIQRVGDIELNWLFSFMIA